MGERCATRSYLQLVSTERVWTGKPSTTQLIRGTLEAYLTLTEEYSISPDSRAFMIHGTKGHAVLESSSDELSSLEERFDGYEVEETGITDVVETEDGISVMVDYKTSGSFKVAKALGFKVIEKESEEIFKSGKRKGEKKLIKELVRKIEFEDRWEWELQLNKYRIEWEKKHIPRKISKLKIQCCVRDGSTYIARSRGIFRNIYYFDLRIMPDLEVLEYFKRKRNALLNALKTKTTPHHCDAKENWDGLKCAKYCQVAEFCNFGKYIYQTKQTEGEMITGLSSIRRLPRLGKIRLGIKKKTAEGKEYPVEVDYFVFDPQTVSELENKNLTDSFHKLFGEKPKQLRIMIPLPETEAFFPQYYKRYGGKVLKCKGDGLEAECISEDFSTGLEKIGLGEFGIKVKCKGQECGYYKEKKCTESASISFLIPELPGAGVWQITTGSFHSIVSLNSSLDMIRAVCGRFHMIPLILERIEQDITHEGKTSKHYPMKINMGFQFSELQRYATIDPTRALLALPPIEEDKEDLMFGENTVINTGVDVLLINESQIADLKALLTENKSIGQKMFIRYLVDKFSCDSIDDITANDYPGICETISKKPEEITKYKQI
jgi:hypothetical protein